MSTGSRKNQTQTYLKQRLAAAGIHTDTGKGQNFLIDLNLLRLLVDTAELSSDDVLLEVGTGTGSLTAILAPQVAHVVTVEIDPRLHQLASESLWDVGNVTLLRQDALKNKNQLQPAVLEAVESQLAADPRRRFKLVANLPYNVATPVISNLLAADTVPALMAVTIQKELGERIVARPATKDYGALSIWLQSQCDVEIVRIMPPAAFWPRPKVHSAIVRIAFRPDLRRRIADLEFFHSFVRSMFFHRRKFLRSELVSACKGRLEKPDVDRVMEAMGFDANTRAEELAVETMIALAETVRQAIAAKQGQEG